MLLHVGPAAAAPLSVLKAASGGRGSGAEHVHQSVVCNAVHKYRRLRSRHFAQGLHALPCFALPSCDWMKYFEGTVLSHARRILSLVRHVCMLHFSKTWEWNSSGRYQYLSLVGEGRHF